MSFLGKTISDMELSKVALPICSELFVLFLAFLLLLTTVQHHLQLGVQKCWEERIQHWGEGNKVDNRMPFSVAVLCPTTSVTSPCQFGIIWSLL